MSKAFCDRCGSEMPEGLLTPAPGGRLLCAPCRASSVPARPSRFRAVLGALLAAGIAGWVGYRLVAIEGRLARSEVRPAPPEFLPSSPPPAFSPEEIAALKRLLADPPASREELAALRQAMSRLSEPVRPGVPAALQSVPMPAPIPGPAAVVETAPDSPLPPPSSTSELSSADPLVRYRALEGLSRPEEAAEASALLSDEMGFVRRAAAAALGRLKVPGTVPGLVAMARREKDVAALLAALQALQDITGVGSGPGEPAATALAASEAWWVSRQRAEGRKP